MNKELVSHEFYSIYQEIEEILSESGWIKPYVSVGEIIIGLSLEWIVYDRKLTIFIRDKDDIRYMKQSQDTFGVDVLTNEELYRLIPVYQWLLYD